MKRRAHCPVCGNSFTLNKHGKLPGHALTGAVVGIMKKCEGSGIFWIGPMKEKP